MYKEGDILTLENDWRGEHCVFILHKVYNEDWIEAHAKYSFIFKKIRNRGRQYLYECKVLYRVSKESK